MGGFDHLLPGPRDSLTLRALGSPCGFSFLAVAGSFRRLRLRGILARGVAHFLLRLNGKFTFMKHRVPLRMNSRAVCPSLLFCRLRLHYCYMVRLGIRGFGPRFVNRLNACVDTMGRLGYGPNSAPAVNLLVYGAGGRMVTRCTLRSAGRPVNVSRCRLSGLVPRSVGDRLPSVRRVRRRMGEVRKGGRRRE